MNDRARRVSALYHDALGRPEAERAAFVHAAAADDDALRDEVTSLLAYQAAADPFLESHVASRTNVPGDDAPRNLVGMRAGFYDIVTRIGAGGMGEVYLAYDRTLGRNVALKILPEVFARDPDRVARFEREARALATLNHPGIAQVYGIETTGPIQAIAMELVEGPTLEERLRGGPLPLAECLSLARQLADALEAAHEAGIIHRDLKPANVKVREDGVVKVLDFGLAKARAGSGLGDKRVITVGDSAPTIAAPDATSVGTILGTAFYMAPEQAQGRPVDRRADVWAFGVVLFEMLTGRRPFVGQDTRAVLASVIGEPAPLGLLAPTTPEPIRRLLRRCLEKDPRQRLADLATARLEISDALAAPMVERSNPWRARIVWSAAALAVVVAAAGSYFGRRAGAATDAAPLARFAMALPTDQALGQLQRSVAISPDGRRVAYVVNRPQPRIFVRALDDLVAVEVPGTESATSPFFSPDGMWLGFWRNRQLFKVSLEGEGQPVALCPARTVYGASWTEAGRIVFGQAHTGIFEVSAGGGPARLLVAPDRSRGEIAVESPQLLPGGASVLFTVLSEGHNWDDAKVVVQDLAAGTRRVVLDGGADGRYLRSGHLLFVRGTSLYAVWVNPTTLAAEGAPVPLVSDLARSLMYETGAGQFDVSATGTLVHQPGGPPRASTLVWVDRTGVEDPLPVPDKSYFHPRLSPDGQRIIVDTIVEQDLWVFELARKTLARVTSTQTSLHPVWTVDGRSVIFDADLGLALQRRNIEGSPTSPIVSADYPSHVTAVSASPDGRVIAVERSDDFFAFDIGVVSLDAERTLRPILSDPKFREMSPMFSPDGKWLAYVSDETGQNEVYVQPYPRLDNRWLVSNGGGAEPQWSRTGSEIFYRTGVGRSTMMAVPVRTAPAFMAGQPQRLFSANPGTYWTESVGAHPTYDVSPDGRRFLMVKGRQQGPRNSTLTVTLNWSQELLQRVAPR